ncbi:cytochrome b5, heme-binding site-containing protein [Artemisia annua]|uniref:Cytochrome b5, heme-binding site-containing protein n=1 Tax=Artemisia annua TaxID=35608 RepID=A0A2U1MQU3_ARTAN|nr:cytochrome b5, heme-binding site-containing protein [Artemisia annua]
MERFVDRLLTKTPSLADLLQIGAEKGRLAPRRRLGGRLDRFLQHWVYDVTKFLDDHPGGEEVLLSAAEKDATEDFEDTGHSQNARDMMEDYYIGEFETNSMPKKNSYTLPSNSTAASESSKQVSGSSSTNIIAFALPILILVIAYLYYIAKKEVVISHK